MVNLHTEFAAMVLAFARAHKLFRIVDFGAGSGRLLDVLSSMDPGLELHGIDQRQANVAFDWIVDKWSSRTGDWTTGSVLQLLTTLRTPVLALAIEWLDDIPCTIAERTPVLRATGPDGPTELLPQEEVGWADQWWPTGKIAEIGLTRDRVWQSLAHTLPLGSILLMIDYGHIRNDRPVRGTFTGYRNGRQRTPQRHRNPSDMNLTAHVAVDSLAASVEMIGARRLLFTRQHALAHLFPPLPEDPLAALAARSRREALTAPHVFGNFWWLAHQVTGAGEPARVAP